MKLILKERETHIQSRIIKWLNLQSNTMAWKANSTGIPDGKGGFRKNPYKGIADIIGIVGDGKGCAAPFAMEVKSPNGKEPWKRCSDEQKIFLTRFGAISKNAFVVDSLEDAIECFKEINGG